MKYILVASEFSAEQADAVTNYFKDKPEYGYWHWIPSVWLIDSDRYFGSAGELRDIVKEIVPGGIFFVFEVELPAGRMGWSAFCPPTWSKWLHDYWK